MHDITDMVWVELHKALRSRMPLWTALGSLFMPLGISFLIFVSRNPAVSQQLGLISAKANLLAYAGAGWADYLGMFGQLLAAGGFILFVLVVSWVFGREFVDGTLKDMWAVPVPRSSILLAKFIVTALWSLVLAMLILLFGLLMGWLIGLPGALPGVLLHGVVVCLVTASLTVVAVLPFAFFASLGRGYLLPVGAAVLTLMLTNLVVIAGWGEYFPWAVAGLYAQEKSVLPALSYWTVLLTGLLGMFVTYMWWTFADQNR
jgi:ABC-2 type transport system permease protein